MMETKRDMYLQLFWRAAGKWIGCDLPICRICLCYQAFRKIPAQSLAYFSQFVYNKHCEKMRKLIEQIGSARGE